MDVSLYFEYASSIDLFNTFMNKYNDPTNRRYFNGVKGVYIATKLMFTIVENERLKDFKSPKFGKLFGFKKPLTFLPDCHLLYNEIMEELNDDNIDNPNEDENQKITTFDYLQKFYEMQTGEDEEIAEFLFSDACFARYYEFYNILYSRFAEIQKERNSSNLLSFIPHIQALNNDKFISNQLISPYQYIELNPNSKGNTYSLERFFQDFSAILTDFSDFLLYISLEDLSRIDEMVGKETLRQFRNILVWVPNFNEYYATKDNIQKLHIGLQKLHDINPSIIFLFGGLMIYHFFQDLIKEVVIRYDVYPGKKKIPNKEPRGKRTKRIFFPYFGQLTTSEKILDPQYREFFNCDCKTCSEIISEGNNDEELLLALDESARKRFYHNLFSFLKKIIDNDVIEVDPTLNFDGKRLFTNWESALSE